jgi:hypothetical protein
MFFTEDADEIFSHCKGLKRRNTGVEKLSCDGDDDDVMGKSCLLVPVVLLSSYERSSLICRVILVYTTTGEMFFEVSDVLELKVTSFGGCVAEITAERAEELSHLVFAC